jgi:hypothetical protein
LVLQHLQPRDHLLPAFRSLDRLARRLVSPQASDRESPTAFGPSNAAPGAAARFGYWLRGQGLANMKRRSTRTGLTPKSCLILPTLISKSSASSWGTASGYSRQSPG